MDNGSTTSPTIQLAKTVKPPAEPGELLVSATLNLALNYLLVIPSTRISYLTFPGFSSARWCLAGRSVLPKGDRADERHVCWGIATDGPIIGLFLATTLLQTKS